MKKDKHGRINQSSYIAMNIRLQKALNPPHREEEAIEGAEQDWEADIARSCNAAAQVEEMESGLGFEAFVLSIIEMLCLWAESDDETSLLKLLQQLLDTVTSCPHKRKPAARRYESMKWSLKGQKILQLQVEEHRRH